MYEKVIHRKFITYNIEMQFSYSIFIKIYNIGNIWKLKTIDKINNKRIMCNKNFFGVGFCNFKYLILFLMLFILFFYNYFNLITFTKINYY